jgi:hypothetical protein
VTRKLRIVRRTPSLLGVCELCRAEFSGSMVEVLAAFNAHRCTPLDKHPVGPNGTLGVFPHSRRGATCGADALLYVTQRRESLAWNTPAPFIGNVQAIFHAVGWPFLGLGQRPRISDVHALSASR